MTIDEILDMMDDMLDRAWNLPLTGGRSVLDAEKLREMIDDIRLNLPGELKQAKIRPEEYSHIVVRISGFCAYFVDLPDSLQDEIIGRTLHQV